MNNVSLCGRLYKEVELRQSQGGKSMARTGIAVKRDFKNSEGKYDSDFINLIAWGSTAEFMSKYFSKGSMIAITGKIQTGSYKDKNGSTVYTTDVVVNTAEFCDSKGGNSQSGQKAAAPTKQDDGEFMNIPDGIEEELPFN
jgi:single-strand DNA-binding protein